MQSEAQMVLDLLPNNLSKGSHKKIFVKCDFKASEKCRNKYHLEYREYLKLVSNNSGKLICLYCSRRLKSAGRNNPNTKYSNIDDGFFKKIDSVEKAYLLGWIASDGHVGKRGFKISIHQKDIAILKNIKRMIDDRVPIRKFNTPTSQMCSIEFNSIEMSKDLCRWLGINPGRKCETVRFPRLNRKLSLMFLRGYFEGDGCIASPERKKKSPVVHITSNSKSMLKSIRSLIGLPCYLGRKYVSWYTNKAIQFLDLIYAGHLDLKLKRKYDLYIFWKKNYVFNSLVNIRRGKNHPNYGKKFSYETRRKISVSHRGEKSYSAKLNWKKVKNIRRMYGTDNYSFADLAREFSISRSTINSIIQKHTWIETK